MSGDAAKALSDIIPAASNASKAKSSRHEHDFWSVDCFIYSITSIWLMVRRHRFTFIRYDIGFSFFSLKNFERLFSSQLADNCPGLNGSRLAGIVLFLQDSKRRLVKENDGF
jgi:hypothetical protein